MVVEHNVMILLIYIYTIIYMAVRILLALLQSMSDPTVSGCRWPHLTVDQLPLAEVRHR